MHTVTKDEGINSICLWWVMIEAERELNGEDRIPDDAVILHFMGSGASHQVTAAQIRAAIS